MDLFADDPILPAEPPGYEVLHDREYRVRAYRKADDLLLVRGAVRDQKPPGLYLDADPDPLTIHHMQVELEVAFPSLRIERAAVVFETHPQETCPGITGHYGRLVGLSIGRGFTHEVRQLFGGPRGCTHTTALLQAMAPVAVQCFWSMRASAARRAGQGDGVGAGRAGIVSAEQMWASNVNTCHVWAEDGEHVAAMRAGEGAVVPLFLRTRLDALGIDAREWEGRMDG